MPGPGQGGGVGTGRRQVSGIRALHGLRSDWTRDWKALNPEIVWTLLSSVYRD